MRRHGLQTLKTATDFPVDVWISSVRRLSTCSAVLVTRFGGPEVLEYRTGVGLPDVGPNEVLIRTRAVSVNPLDLRMRGGYGKSLFKPLLPIVLGRDVSGEVSAVGNAVRHLQIGEEVFGALHPTAIRGTYSDYAILAEEQLIRKPASLSHVDAAAIPFAALTAWRALRSTARIQKGQKLLIIGGGGSVGLAAIYLAKAVGCYVAVTCGQRSTKNVKEAGAEQAIDYTSEDIREQLKDRFDAVLDTIGMPETESLGTNVLKRGGHYLTLQGEIVSMADKYGLVAGGAAAAAKLVQKQMQYRQSHGIEYWWSVMRTDSEALEEICRLASEGRLKVPVERTFSLADAAEAHREREGKKTVGKVVLEVE
ncbi:hypothetical protein R1sor_027405 [Riccia sorocarpa]|uniref:Enoyl reductase (ER) domain-containing protein n=1 Tax=Riccia sorocarpa TaxID=122646 RepID=A0ABD3GFU4_9MARC